jgi:hypothetical protein
VLVPGPDLHRDKLGFADDADRQAIRELRLIAAGLLAAGILAWLLGAGIFPLLAAVVVTAAIVNWRAWSLRRRARRGPAQ